MFHNRNYLKVCLKLKRNIHSTKLLRNWLDKSRIFFNISCKVITLISFVLWHTGLFSNWMLFSLFSLVLFISMATSLPLRDQNVDPYGIVHNLVFESTYKTLIIRFFIYMRGKHITNSYPIFAFNTDLIEQRTGMYIKLPINHDCQIWMFISNISAIKLRVELTRIETFFTYSLEFKGQLYGNEGRHIRVHDVRSVHGNIGSVNVHTE